MAQVAGDEALSKACALVNYLDEGIGLADFLSLTVKLSTICTSNGFSTLPTFPQHGNNISL